ncbi:hypothetical protein HDM29_01695 [Bordetella pertussis]|nr:hypothetical protein HDM29_01695 [Bordetella pertussis]
MERYTHSEVRENGILELRIVELIRKKEGGEKKKIWGIRGINTWAHKIIKGEE